MLHIVGTINLTIPRKIIGPRNALLLFKLEGGGIPMPTPIAVRHHQSLRLQLFLQAVTNHVHHFNKLRPYSSPIVERCIFQRQPRFDFMQGKREYFLIAVSCYFTMVLMFQKAKAIMLHAILKKSFLPSHLITFSFLVFLQLYTHARKHPGLKKKEKKKNKRKLPRQRHADFTFLNLENF